MLGPVVGPLGRVVKGGRNWEGKHGTHILLSCQGADLGNLGISPDPYLSGVLVHQLVAGTQDAGVVANTKARVLTPSGFKGATDVPLSM